MVKTLKDVMTRMGFWIDDAQVACEQVSKLWDTEPRIEIEISQMEKRRND